MYPHDHSQHANVPPCPLSVCQCTPMPTISVSMYTSDHCQRVNVPRDHSQRVNVPRDHCQRVNVPS